MTRSLALLSLGLLVAVPACAASANGETGGPPSEDEVVGITDLGTLERALSFTKDAADAQGHFRRSDAALHAGPCFKRTIGSANGASFEVRRYTNGAAFFHKKGTAV